MLPLELKPEPEPELQISSLRYNSPLTPEKIVGLLDQINDKPLSFYKKKREVIYLQTLVNRITHFDSKSDVGVFSQDEINHMYLFFQDFNKFYSFNDILLPLPTPNKVNLLRYEMQPIGKKYTDKPNALAILAFGDQTAFLIDRMGGLFYFLGIQKSLRGLNLKIAESLNRSYIQICREINVLSIRYRPHPFADVYDGHSAFPRTNRRH